VRVQRWQTSMRNESEGAFGAPRWDPAFTRRSTIDRSGPERPTQGTEAGTPGKAVRPTGRTCSYGWDS
jgi:hypothetical protein